MYCLIIAMYHDFSSGKIVICYFSAGTYEDWRDDVQSLDDDYLGNQLEDWPDEKWWDVTEDSVRDIVSSRLDLAVSDLYM